MLVQANAIGRGGKTLKEYLEKNYEDGKSSDEIIRLCVKSLLEVVESGGKNIEVAVLRANRPMEYLSEEVLEELVKSIEAEKEAAKAEEKARRLAGAAAATASS
jgi:20S proteasome subunit alpha 4